MNPHERSSLLGLPPHLDEESALTLRRALTEIWTITVGAGPGELEADLDVCRRWFDPVAQGQRLRRELAQLKPSPPEVPDPGAPLTLSVGKSKRLVTPEGRCALDLLERLSSSGSITIADAQTIPYDRLLGQLYRKWSRHRLQSVVSLLSGSDKPLQIPAAGVVIALLVNRCTSEGRALTRFASGSARDVVDRAFFTPVQVFSDTLAPQRRGNRNDPRLVSGWMLYEARRRLGQDLVVIDARGGVDGKVWITPESELDVIDKVCRDLARGHRSPVSLTGVATAFDALVNELRKELPKLAAFGLVHERPHDTQRLRKRLLASLRRYLEENE